MKYHSSKLKIDIRKSDIIGLILYYMGVPHRCSESIAGFITRGYGRLDNIGHWQYEIFLKNKTGNPGNTEED